MTSYKETNNISIGRGDIFFARRKADGTLGGERPLGNTPAFNIGVQTQSVKHYSSARGMKVQDRSVPVQTDYSGSIDCDDINPHNLAALLLGSVSTVAVTTLAAQTETLSDVEQGLSYQVGVSDTFPTGLRNITITDVKVGVTSKTEGTDYTKDEALGRITIVEGGSIADAADVIVEFDRNAYSQNAIVSGATVVEGAIRFIAYNPEGEDINYYLPDVKLSPNGDFQIKTDQDFQKMSFNLEISTPVGGNAIYADGAPFTP